MDQVVEPACGVAPPRVLDPACGDGRLLRAAGAVIARRFGVDPRPFLRGIELDPRLAESTSQSLGITVLAGDARACEAYCGGGDAVDVVIGNPPYLSQLAAATARGGRSELGGGVYADVAAEFLALAVRLVRPVGGRIGLVLPLSILATRDVAPIRSAVDRVAALDAFWWSDTSVFDAQIRTCIVSLVTG